MEEKPKRIWSRAWKIPKGLLIWITASGGILLTILVFGIVNASPPADADDYTTTILASLGGGVVVVCAWIFARWLDRPGNKKRMAIGFGCCVLLLILAWVEENWRGKRAWENFRHEWEAKGEKFDRQAVVPAPVPDESNFAMTAIAFSGYGKLLTKDGKAIPSEKRDTNFINQLELPLADYSLEEPTNGAGSWAEAVETDLRPWQGYYRALAATTNLFPVPVQAQSPAADVLLALSKYDATIEKLRLASRLPSSRFPLNYDVENPSAIWLPHLTSLKHAVQTLELRAIAELQNGQSAKAASDVSLMLRLTDSMHTEPILISHLVRISMVRITLQPIYEGLAERRWSDEQLVELDTALAQLDLLSDYTFAMRGELALFQCGSFEFMRRHPEELFNITDVDYDYRSFPNKAFSRMIPTGWFYQNQLHCARMVIEHYIPAVDISRKVVLPASVRKANDVFEADTQHLTPYNFFERMELAGFGGDAKKFAYAQSSVNLARVAIALECYRLAQGEYPKTIDLLQPKIASELPHDIISGQPLKYRREVGGQFVLYSVGWNETDDGGVVVFRELWPDRADIDKGDWVWRYPAK